MPVRDQIPANEQGNTTFATFLDALLPQLLSGAVRLRDAEKLVEVMV